LGTAILIMAWMWLAHMPDAYDYRQLTLAVVCGSAGSIAQVVFVRQARRMHASRSEALRWLGLAAVCVWVIHPYATPHLVGGGDAHHYAQQLADSATQFRQGEYQLFVGQSSFAFNGDIHPLRTAPYFSYLGAALSIITGPTFAPTAVQNLMIVLSLCGGVAALYVLLTRLRPSAGWPAFWLTIAFASCPGVLALVYSGDMVASWLTLPWLPLVFYATIRCWHAPDPLPAFCLLAGSLALVWLAHPPIAFWTSVLVALPLIARSIVRWESGRGLWLIAACTECCLVLCSYVFVSVHTLEMPTDPNLVACVRSGGVLEILRTSWAGLGRPIDPTGADLLHNLQLSPALWFAALIGVGSIRRHRWVAGMLLLGSAILLLLLYPSPSIAGRLWQIMPESVISATDKWPMQRFYPILSVVVPFLALLAWPATTTRRRNFFATTLLVGLGSATLFSLVDAHKFVARGRAASSSPEMSARRLRSENVVLSRYSYEYYGRLPRVFTHGTVSPWMQNRLLARNTLTPADINLRALGPDTPRGPVFARSRHRFIPTEYGGYYVPPLRLEPARTYFVRFIFGTERADGTLQLLGRYIYREYPLPMSGELHAFGIGLPRRNGFSLWTTAPVADDIEMRFYSQNSHPTPENLGDVELLAVNPDRLPLQLLSLQPYQVAVRSTVLSWLEMPKLYLPGYIADIDGQTVSVERSPDGLAMVPVPAGQHRVQLSYVGPLALRLAYWATVAAWVLFLIFWRWRRHTPKAALAFINLGRTATAFALIGLVSWGAAKGYAAYRVSPPPSLAVGPVEVKFTLPVGLEKKWEHLWDFENANTQWSVHCYYENGQNLRIGLVRDSHLVAVSEAFQVNYLRQHRLVATLTPDPLGREPRLRVWVNQRLVLRPNLTKTAYGREVPPAPFSGNILRLGIGDAPIN
jgi:hypothetical protein